MKKLVIILLLSGVASAQEQGHKVYNSFSGGELSPLLNMKEDLTKFHSGCSLMENMIPLPQGAAQKRPGTVYVAESKNNTKIRLIPFEYSTEQSYIIEAGNQYMRFYTDNDTVLDGVGTDDLSGLDNLITHYKLDEDTSTSVINDDNPGGYIGTASADISILTSTGKVGTCFDLDAQYDVSISHDNIFSFTDDADDTTFSFVCWAYITTYDDIEVLMSKWRDDNATREWRFYLDSDRKLNLELADTSADLSGDRVAQWYLNDDAADTHVDDVTTNHDGVCSVNTDTISTTGKINDCYDFGGSAYFTVADHANLSFGNGSSDSAFSIAAWVYVTDHTAQQIIYAKADFTAAANAREYMLSLTTSELLYFRLYDESWNSLVRCYSTDSLSTGWHFIVATYDGTGGVTAYTGMEVYVDGSNVSGTKNASGLYVAMENTATVVSVGAVEGSGGTYTSIYQDKMDNVILFDSELSPANVQSLYNDGTGTESMAAAVASSVTDNAIDPGWHMTAVTYSAPADESTAADGIIFYVDGSAVNSTATNDSGYTAMQSGAEEIRFGSQRNTGDSASEKFFADKIDEIAIFSDVLTPTEVASLYSTTLYEIDTPYLTADLFELKYKQSADVLYISHPDYETRKLSRYADALWTLDSAVIETGPFRDENTDETYLITPSGITGSITLTASGTDFRPFEGGATAGHEPSGTTAASKCRTGALFKIVQPLDTQAYEEILSDNYTDDQNEDVSWLDCGSIARGVTWYLTTLGTWTGTLEVQRNYTIGAAHGADGWETVYTFQSTDDRNVTTNAEEGVGEADYRCILTASGDAAEPLQVYFRISDTDHIGVVEITAVSSPTSATATVIKTLANTDATHRWSEGSWSNYRGWPRTVTFFEDRLTFGGNSSQPDTIWASETANYDNFLADADDSDPLSFTLSSRQVNVIEWLVGKDKLMIGTSGAEWTLSGSSDEPLTPSNVKAEQHSNYGSADLQAVLANESVLFFQRGAEKMRELAFNWELDSYVAPDMTILADHITGDGITNTDYQKIPNAILYCVRDDGELAVFVYERKELITSWSRFITDGLFESVAVITDDPEDQVWVSVNRTINGNTVRYIEYFSDRYFGTDVDDAYFVDSGITYDSTATETITGLDHLEGETVAVLGDGAVQTSQTVSSGQITITSASTVQTGLPFTVQMRTMPLSLAEQGASILGRTKRITQVIPQYYNSGDFYIGRDSSDKELLSITGMDTSDVDTEDEITFPHGYDRYGYIYVYQSSSEALTLLGLCVDFSVN